MTFFPSSFLAETRRWRQAKKTSCTICGTQAAAAAAAAAAARWWCHNNGSESESGRLAERRWRHGNTDGKGGRMSHVNDVMTNSTETCLAVWRGENIYERNVRPQRPCLGLSKEENHFFQKPAKYQSDNTRDYNTEKLLTLLNYIFRETTTVTQSCNIFCFKSIRNRDLTLSNRILAEINW